VAIERVLVGLAGLAAASVLAAPAGAVGPPMSMGSVVGKATRDAASRCHRHVARLPEQYRLIAECESPAAACTLSRSRRYADCALDYLITEIPAHAPLVYCFTQSVTYRSSFPLGRPRRYGPRARWQCSPGAPTA
jgi:hypothetical protein